MVSNVPIFVQNEDLWQAVQFAGHHHSELPVHVVVGGKVPVALVHPTDKLWVVLREIGADGVEVEVGLLLPAIVFILDGIQLHAARAAGGEPEHEHSGLAVFLKNLGRVEGVALGIAQRNIVWESGLDLIGWTSSVHVIVALSWLDDDGCCGVFLGCRVGILAAGRKKETGENGYDEKLAHGFFIEIVGLLY